jgi:hypothetical protein
MDLLQQKVNVFTILLIAKKLKKIMLIDFDIDENAER